MLKFWRSSIGKKIIMALSGAFLIVFIIGHLLGNLGVFSGQEAMNSYAELLRSVPKLLWAVRIALISAFVLHIVTSIQLSIENKKARPVNYVSKKSVQATLASRTMLWGGLVVLSFLLYHLAHLTFGITNPEEAALLDDKGRHDVYNMVVLGFQNVYVSGFYIVAQVCLAFHLSHGFSSAAQTFGLANRGIAKVVRQGGVAFAVVICVLYVSIPFSVIMGWLSAV